MSERLFKELSKYSKSDYYPFHMPGHKRNRSIDFLKDAYEIDITEIEGFDNLHDAKGIIKEAEESAAKLYKSSETHYLVNGSSSGILSAILSVTNKKDKIIVARNCHNSVYNAIFLNDLKPIYIYPETILDEKISSSITPEDVEKVILENPDAKAVIITSPTYDGIISDVAGIAKKVHEFDIPLIVDEAHGALFYIEGRSAVINNADIVINSLHKTLPALTGTALIHINGDIVDRERVRKYLSIFQTSSPSYVLMASIDYAIYIMENEGARLYRDYCVRLYRIKEELKGLRNLKLLNRDSFIYNGAFDYDESKIIISSLKCSGKELSDILLNKYHIQTEMQTVTYALLMHTVMDTDEGVDRLINALKEIDDNISNDSCDLYKSEKITNTLKERLNEISDKTVFVYPPGIPIIVSGEVITKEIIDEIDRDIEASLDIKGL